MSKLTGALADDACADVVDLIPGFVTDGQACLATSLELRRGAVVLGAAAVLQWATIRWSVAAAPVPRAPCLPAEPEPAAWREQVRDSRLREAAPLE